jgi:hypothetical protein
MPLKCQLAVFGAKPSFGQTAGGCMTGIVATFKALTLEAQTEAYPQITAAFNTSKDARRLQLDAEKDNAKKPHEQAAAKG